MCSPAYSSHSTRWPYGLCSYCNLRSPRGRAVSKAGGFGELHLFNCIADGPEIIIKIMKWYKCGLHTDEPTIVTDARLACLAIQYLNTECRLTEVIGVQIRLCSHQQIAVSEMDTSSAIAFDCELAGVLTGGLSS